MLVGFASINTAEDIEPSRVARELEDRGYESLWIGEHSHIPVSRQTPYPAGGEIPKPYLGMMDPYVSLMAAGAASTRLRLATGVTLLLERDLIATAKEIATLDVLSGGRVIVGVGPGWNREQFENHTDIPWSRRHRALRECVLAMRELWTQEKAEFHGEFFDFDPVWSFPKPRQKPAPPVLLGAVGRLGTAHATEWADGWAPIDIGLGNVEKKLGLFRAAAERAGRDPNSIEISMFAWGDPDRTTLESYRDLGIARVVLGAGRTDWDDPTTTLPFLDAYAPLIPDLA